MKFNPIIKLNFKLRYYILLPFVFIAADICHAQNNIWGLYINNDGAYRSIHLKPDSTYYYEFGDRCGGSYKETGNYNTIADTLYLFKTGADTNDKSKFLMLNESNILSYYDTVIDSETLEKFAVCLWQPNSIAAIWESDSILPLNNAGRISDYLVLLSGSYVKTSAYYDNGNLKFYEQNSSKIKIVTNYHLNGQISLIEHYYKNKKTGDWIYYSETGTVIQIDTYKNGRLKRLKRSNL
ncbi:MAG: hypothetical protein WAT43_07920 [Chitinophagales bacterium]